MAMIETNVAELKNNLSKFLNIVEKGQAIQICKRNIPIARLVPWESPKIRKNHTQLGCGQGSVRIKSDLTAPMIPEESWEMLQK